MRTVTPAALLDEIDTLREENRQLRDLLLPQGMLPRHWKLTKSESLLVRALAAGGGTAVSMERILSAMYGTDHERDHEVIRVTILHIRRKHDTHGLTITTHRGYGYAMPPDDCAAVRAALAAPRLATRSAPPIGALTAAA